MTIEEIESHLKLLSACVKSMKTEPIKKSIPPKDAKVHVWYDSKADQYRRYSTGCLDEAGRLLCYSDGQTSWTYGCSWNTLPIVPWENWEVVDTKA